MTFIRSLVLALAACVSQPAFAAPALDLSAYRGKVVVVDFWASWCGPCKLAFPAMARIQQHKRPADLVVITVNVERSRAPGEAFLKQVQVKLPVIWDSDGAIVRQYAVNDMPTTLLFDRKGQLRWRHSGFVAGDEGVVAAQADQLIRAK